MYDIFDIMSFYAYDIDAVTEYVETISAESSKFECGRLHGPGNLRRDWQELDRDP